MHPLHHGLRVTPRAHGHARGSALLGDLVKRQSALAGAGMARAEGVLRHRRARRVTLGAVDAPLPVQLDGDPLGRVIRLDARIDVAALSVRVTGSHL